MFYGLPFTGKLNFLLPEHAEQYKYFSFEMFLKNCYFEKLI